MVLILVLDHKHKVTQMRKEFKFISNSLEGGIYEEKRKEKLLKTQVKPLNKAIGELKSNLQELRLDLLHIETLMSHT